VTDLVVALTAGQGPGSAFQPGPLAGPRFEPSPLAYQRPALVAANHYAERTLPAYRSGHASANAASTLVLDLVFSGLAEDPLEALFANG
jgi:hypothetical protein